MRIWRRPEATRGSAEQSGVHHTSFVQQHDLIREPFVFPVLEFASVPFQGGMDCIGRIPGQFRILREATPERAMHMMDSLPYAFAKQIQNHSRYRGFAGSGIPAQDGGSFPRAITRTNSSAPGKKPFSLNSPGNG
jgi:hypothetical protein